ncbi:MAG: hypothetical protein OXC07_08080, partial [Kistimonas sp.]|nr:hypothetical protein [Kistimonas sp.]
EIICCPCLVHRKLAARFSTLQSDCHLAHQMAACRSAQTAQGCSILERPCVVLKTWILHQVLRWFSSLDFPSTEPEARRSR